MRRAANAIAKKFQLNNLPVNKPAPDYNVILQPAIVSPRRSVPAHINQPPYAASSHPATPTDTDSYNRIPPTLTPSDITALRRACNLTKLALDQVALLIKPGITGDAIDAAIHDFIIAGGGYPSPLGYLGNI